MLSLCSRSATWLGTLVWLGSCSSAADKEPSNDGFGQPSADLTTAAAAENNLQTLRDYLDVYQTKDYEKARAAFSPDFRHYAGSKFGRPVSGANILDEFVKNWKTRPQANFPQLIIADDNHGFEYTLATVRSSEKAERTAYPYIRLYRFKDGKIRSRSYWRDGLTRFHQQGVVGFDDSPDDEAPLTEEIVASARGDEREATQTARVKAMLDSIAASDAAGVVEHLAPGFVDRDLTRKQPIGYASPSDFEQATAAWLALSDASAVKIIDVWSVKEWTVAEFSRSYQLKKATVHPEYKDAKARAALNYIVWLVRFDDDGLIAERWRLHDRNNEILELHAIDPRELIRRRSAANAGVRK